jgi:hypothetical protein
VPWCVCENHTARRLESGGLHPPPGPLRKSLPGEKSLLAQVSQRRRRRRHAPAPRATHRPCMGDDGAMCRSSLVSSVREYLDRHEGFCSPRRGADCAQAERGTTSSGLDPGVSESTTHVLTGEKSAPSLCLHPRWHHGEKSAPPCACTLAGTTVKEKLIPSSYQNIRR